MKPTDEQLARLEECRGDNENYHSTFDDLLEERLMELDPEWMQAMRKVYKASGMRRWCA